MTGFLWMAMLIISQTDAFRLQPRSRSSRSNMSAVRASESFPIDVPVFIRSHRNQYLKDEQGQVKISKYSGTWEQWVISDAGNGTVTIKSHRSQNLQDNEGQARLSGNTQEWEQWKISSAGNGKVTIRSHRNEHLQDSHGQVKLTENSDEWEHWSIVAVKGPPGSPCLCLFDIDRTLTGKQGDTTKCPDNKVLEGIKDPGYGWGDATLSQLASVGIASTFCGECYLGIVSAGGGNGENSAWNNYLLDEVMRSPPQDKFQAEHPHAKRWSYGTKVQSPYVLYQGNKVKQHSVEGVRQWYGRHGIEIAPGDVYFYGDRTENMQPFSQYSINSKEISCGSRDWRLYGGSGIVGYCGARTEELQREEGQILCQ